MKKVISIIFLLVIMSFIYYMSAQSAPVSSRFNVKVVEFISAIFNTDLYSLYEKDYVDVIIRKLGHFSEFSLLCAASYLFFNAFKVKWTTLMTILFCMFYAIFDEYHQLYVLGRESSIIDVFIDLLGVMFAISVISIIRVISYEMFKSNEDYKWERAEK